MGGGIVPVVIDWVGVGNAADLTDVALKGALLVALILALFQIVDSLYSVRIGHWRARKLRVYLVSKLVLGVIPVVSSAAAVVALGGNAVALAVLGVAVGIAAIAYDVVEHAIDGGVDALALARGSDVIWKERPFRFLRPWFSEFDSLPHAAVMRALLMPRPRTGGRGGIVLCMLVISAISCSSALALAVTGSHGPSLNDKHHDAPHFVSGQ